jgi:hypothetical protein
MHPFFLKSLLPILCQLCRHRRWLRGDTPLLQLDCGDLPVRPRTQPFEGVQGSVPQAPRCTFVLSNCLGCMRFFNVLSGLLFGKLVCMIHQPTDGLPSRHALDLPEGQMLPSPSAAGAIAGSASFAGTALSTSAWVGTSSGCTSCGISFCILSAASA